MPVPPTSPHDNLAILVIVVVAAYFCVVYWTLALRLVAIVALTFGIPIAIFTEAALSFVGVGIRPPQASWGQMVGQGQSLVRSYPHLLLFPTMAIGLTMLGFTFLGDGLRDALDPRLARKL